MFMEFFASLIEHFLPMGWWLAAGCELADAQGERLRP
ncbi:unannotated protein [freshwater metagenome]|uniref:Unannotated protein n=1 Tax=freshwater metagenome TaxID=449393 RepID=A0A6J7RM31_9ZZZZ